MAKKNHPLYKTWVKIKERCNCITSDAYKNYGGRGIRLCKEWENNFYKFINDVGEKPTVKHTIDRVDTNGDYSKENCRWATKKEQAIGRRKTRWFNINGENLYLIDVAEKYNIKRKTLEHRLKKGMTIESAITAPIGSINKNQYSK